MPVRCASYERAGADCGPVSGGGTNLQALIDAERAGALGCGQIALVIASRPGVYALERARRAGIETAVVDRRTAADPDGEMVALLSAHRIDLVVLAGFLSILGEKVLERYTDRILNIHPALIPAFCGRGMYGLHVHEAVLRAGVKVTGATVHLVNEVVDGGRILLQKAVEVKEGDTPESLRRRVMEEAEWVLLPQAVRMMCDKWGGKS